MPPLELACPFCQSRHVEALSAEGVYGSLVRQHCRACGKRWSEAVTPRTRGKLTERGLVSARRPLVLNVDDRATSLYARDRLLRLHGFDVANASTGHSALSLAERLQPALILLDVHLPDMDGPDVCARLKAHAATAGIPVVLISATRPESLELEDVGAERFVAEPVEAETLASTLREVLRRADSAARNP